MSSVTQTFREHHHALATELSDYATSFAQAKPTADPQAFVAFLKNELVPHAVGEEAQLYPLMDELVRAHGKPTATMSVDHEYIQEYVSQIEATTAKLKNATPDEQNALRAKLGKLGTELNAIFDAHLAKEERVYLPLFEQYVSDEAQQRVLDAMHDGHTAPAMQRIDVRVIPPPQRHVLIFKTFEALGPGEAFEIVNDHDPKPLYYQFSAERAGQFTWEYFDRGPQVWRVQIGKPPKPN
ncbi:MAG: DUF2249 domain-containing protein [Anaerolineae bacterium]|nr:DUF2249 domain-containing protein [Anaerolineae bacterium]